MRELRLPGSRLVQLNYIVQYLLCTPLVCVPCSGSLQQWRLCCNAGGSIYRQPLARSFFKEGGPGSPRFPGHPCMHLPCSKTPDGLLRQTIQAFPCCPRDYKYEGSIDNIHSEALSHGFCIRCLRFVPPLLATTQDSLPAGGQPLPVGFGPTRCH